MKIKSNEFLEKTFFFGLQKQKLKLKLIYSKLELIKKAKKEISLIRKKIKAKKKS